MDLVGLVIKAICGGVSKAMRPGPAEFPSRLGFGGNRYHAVRPDQGTEFARSHPRFIPSMKLLEEMEGTEVADLVPMVRREVFDFAHENPGCAILITRDT